MIPNSILTRFQDDNRAVAPLIGIIILFGFFTIALAGYQAQAVPQQNAETEFQHYQEVQNDLIVIHNAISRAGQQNQPQFESVRLGTTYRERIITLNPPDPAGTLRTEGPYNITIEGDNTKTVETRFLQYQNGYNEIDSGPIYYENSVLYLDSRGGDPVFFEDQSLVRDNGNVVITALQEEFSTSSTGRVTLELYPTDAGAPPLPSPDPSGNIVVTLPTRLESEYWSDQINPGEQDAVREFEYNSSGYPENDDVSAIRMKIDSTKLEFNTVGINDKPDQTGAISDINDGGSDTDGGDGGGDNGSEYINDSQSECVVDIKSNSGGGSYEISFDVKNSGNCGSITLTQFGLEYESNDNNNIEPLARGVNGQNPPNRPAEVNISGSEIGSLRSENGNGYLINGKFNKLNQNATISADGVVNINFGYLYYESASTKNNPLKVTYTVKDTQPTDTRYLTTKLQFEDDTVARIYIEIDNISS